MANRKIGLLCILISILIPLACLGQGKIVRRATPVTTAKPAAKPKQVKPSKPKTKITFSLATTNNGLRRNYSIKDWVALDISEKVKHNKVGLIIESEGSRFLLSLNNNMSNGVCSKGVPYTEALNKTCGQLPTAKQSKIISDHYNEVKNALNNIKADHLCGKGFWCNDGVARNLDDNTPDKSGVGMYRLCTENVEQGFIFPPVKLEGNSQYDFTGSTTPNLILVRHKNKYGFIDKSGKIVVPVQYDEVNGDFGWYEGRPNVIALNDQAYWRDNSDFMSVSQNGHWGVIDRTGKVCIPLEYSAINKKVSDYTWVKKDGLFGCVNKKGNVVIPIQYENPLSYSGFPMLRAKKNGMWGFINEYGKTAVPFQYEFAKEFVNGLAAVVKDGKVGFIDSKGSVVIPFSFEAEYGYDLENNRVLLCSDFNDGYTAIAKKYGKFGIINKLGSAITEFKFDGIDYWVSDGQGLYIANTPGEKHYFDKGGNEYESESEFYQKNDSILAHQGYAQNKYRFGKKLYKEKRYDEAYKWITDFLDSVTPYEGMQENIAEASLYIGCFYYYGYSPINITKYADAYEWLKKATLFGNRDACYFLGWMFEHGQGVPMDKKEAVGYYRMAQGIRDSNDRINQLTNK